MNGKDSKHYCVACRVGSEGRAAASVSSSSFRPIPPRFRKKSDTVLPDARLCARHFQWLLRHFQEDKAQPHLRCLKKPPKRCVELLAGLARVGVNLVQPSESSSAAAGRVKVTQPCCRRGCSAVQRHPIPKDVLPSVSGARVCRACYMWLRRHFGLCSPQHQHCTDTRVTPHCREMLENFRANGVTFRMHAAGTRMAGGGAPEAPGFGDVSPSSAASSGSQVWAPAAAPASQWADPGQASSQYGSRWPGPIPESRGVGQAGMYNHSSLHHSPIGHNHNQAHSAAYAAAALSTAYAQQVQAFYRTNPGYGAGAGGGGGSGAAGAGVGGGGGLGDGTAPAGASAPSSGSMGRPLQRGLSALDMGVRDEVMGLSSPRGAAPRGFGRAANNGSMGAGQHGSLGAGGAVGTSGYVLGFSGARLAPSSGVSVESMAVAPPAVPPRSFDSAVGLFGAPGRPATNGGTGPGLGFGTSMNPTGAPAGAQGRTASPPARPATSAVAKATFTSAMGSGSVDLSTVRPDLLKRWGVEQHMHRVQSGNSAGSGHSNNAAKAKEIMSGWGSERSVVTVDSVNWSVSSKGSTDMARAHPSLKSIFGNDPAVPDSTGGAGAERRLLSRGIPSAQSLLSQDVDMR